MPQLVAAMTPDAEVLLGVRAAVGERDQVVQLDCVRVRATWRLAPVAGTCQDGSSHGLGNVAGVVDGRTLVERGSRGRDHRWVRPRPAPHVGYRVDGGRVRRWSGRSLRDCGRDGPAPVSY